MWDTMCLYCINSFKNAKVAFKCTTCRAETNPTDKINQNLLEEIIKYDKGTFNLLIELKDHSLSTIKVKKEYTIRDVKYIIDKAKKSDFGKYSLMDRGKTLEDDKTLEFYGIIKKK